ncbi:MAG: hypothetical protein ACT4OH_01885 [Methylophilaceae bacterium]
MKNLLDMFFKPKAPFDYVLAEYQPTKTNKPKADITIAEYNLSTPIEHDEMEIDNLYQRN